MPRLLRLSLAACILVAACAPDRSTGVMPPADARLDRAEASDPTPVTIGIEKIGGFQHSGGAAAAEITAFDHVSKRVFVVNGALGSVDVLDVRNPSVPTLVATIDIRKYGAAANSVAAGDGIVAVAVEAPTKTANGMVVFFRATTLKEISTVTVGALPDMVTFTPDGKWLLVANEGEPNDAYTVDPEGSVSIIDVSNVNKPTVRTATFTHLNGQIAQLRAAGVRIFGPGATVAQDLEPEYITVSPDSRTAYVSLQENNAIAEVDVLSATVRKVWPLGYKDHSLARNKLDVSDQDGINIRTWPNLLGMYQPDGIASYMVGGKLYLLTANEGDQREYAGFTENARVRASTSTASIIASGFPNAICGNMSCRENAQLGRLTVTLANGYTPASQTFSPMYVFGARSFSIWDPMAGTQVWDSGDDFEQLTKNLGAIPFNADHSAASAADDRSDNKGPEPEGVVVAQLGRKSYAFVVLERVGGIMAYDVTNPAAPFFVTYINSRFDAIADRGPEAIEFVPAVRSPNKRPLLIVGHEVTGTTAIYALNLQ